MLAYRCSVSFRALLAKAIGRPSWRRAAPIPIFDASTWMVVGLVTSKYVRAMSLQMEALTFSKTFCRELFHSNGTSFLVRALRGAVWSASLEMNGAMNWIMPRNC